MAESGNYDQKRLAQIDNSLINKRIGVRKIDRLDKITYVNRNRYQI